MFCDTLCSVFGVRNDFTALIGRNVALTVPLFLDHDDQNVADMSSQKYAVGRD